MIESGDVTNIELAIQLGQSQGFDMEKLITTRYGGLLDLMRTDYANNFRVIKSDLQLISKIGEVETLMLSNMNISELPQTIHLFKNLENLFLDTNDLTSLPESIGSLRKLEFLDICRNYIQFLPDEMKGLKSLKFLTIDPTNIKDVLELSDYLNLDKLAIESKSTKWLENKELNKYYEQLFIEFEEKKGRDFVVMLQKA